MKTLIIADLHHKVGWDEKCIEHVALDLTVFLGDYFDSFDETPECPSRVAERLKDSLSNPNRVHLLGNHDMPYRFPLSFNLLCPGFTHEKSLLINEILDARALWEKTKSFYWVEGYLLSHAGVHLNLLHPIKGFDLDDLFKVEEDSFAYCSADISTPLFGCGRSRGGNYQTGGITWQDFDMDFSPIEGVNQIIGHTPHANVMVKFLSESDEIIECTWSEFQARYEKEPKKSLNVALDTHRQHYAILENGELEIVRNTFATEHELSQ